MKKTLLAGLATGVLILGLAGMAQANLLTNGSFEDPAITGTWARVAEDAVPGWSTVNYFGPGGWVDGSSVNTAIEIQRDTLFGPAAEGHQYAELDLDSDSGQKVGIWQFLPEAAGQYELTFAFSPRNGVSDNTLGVYIDSAFGTADSTYAWYSFGPVAGSTGTSWTYYSIQFTSLGGDSVVAFFDLGADDSLGTFLDDVKVDPIPEPATMLLMGTGLIGLAGARRKKRA